MRRRQSCAERARAFLPAARALSRLPPSSAGRHSDRGTTRAELHSPLRIPERPLGARLHRRPQHRPGVPFRGGRLFCLPKARGGTRHPVDVIVVDGGSAVGPAMAATKTTPIVIATAGDPVALGFVISLGRPGGNVTGFSLVSIDLNLKRFDILKQALPTARAVTVVFNSQNATAVAGTQAVVEATGEMGIKANLLELPTWKRSGKLSPRTSTTRHPRSSSQTRCSGTIARF